MGFKVVSANGAITEYSDDDASFSVNDQTGVLTVHTEDKRFLFSPSGWLMVEDSVPDGPSVF